MSIPSICTASARDHKIATPTLCSAPDGVFPWILKQKKLGKCRFVGVSSHNAPSMCRQVLETGDVDVLLTVINFIDRHTYNHEGELIPVARKHGTGVIAMKVFGGARRVLPPGEKINLAGPAEMGRTGTSTWPSATHSVCRESPP